MSKDHECKKLRHGKPLLVIVNALPAQLTEKAFGIETKFCCIQHQPELRSSMITFTFCHDFGATTLSLLQYRSLELVIYVWLIGKGKSLARYRHSRCNNALLRWRVLVIVLNGCKYNKITMRIGPNVLQILSHS